MSRPDERFCSRTDVYKSAIVRRSLAKDVKTDTRYGKGQGRHKVQYREQVIAVAKCLDTVIGDIEFVVGDLQNLLEQINVVSRRLDQSPDCARTIIPPVNSWRRMGHKDKKTERPKKTKTWLEGKSSSLKSLGEPAFLEASTKVDSLSRELDEMWDNRFDKELLINGVVNSINSQYTHQSIDDKTVMSARMDCFNKCDNKATSDKSQLCCGDALHNNPESPYCGYYEAIFEACLEPDGRGIGGSGEGTRRGVTFSDSHDDPQLESDANYEPLYDKQLNTWVAHMMPPVVPCFSSEDISNTNYSSLQNI